MVRRLLSILALALAGSASAQQPDETLVATCVFKEAEAAIRIMITQRGEQGYWTEDDRRTEATIVKTAPSDTILGLTANRLDGSLALLSLFRPDRLPYPIRRDAVLTRHETIGDGRIGFKTLVGYCHVEDLR